MKKSIYFLSIFLFFLIIIFACQVTKIKDDKPDSETSASEEQPASSSSSSSSSAASSSASSIDKPEIAGITDGSTYTNNNYVRALWYPKTAAGILFKTDSSKSNSIACGTAITDPGNYTLEVTNTVSNLKTSVSFTITAIADSRETGIFYTNTSLTGRSVEISFESGDYHITQGRPTIGIWAEDLSGNLIHDIYISQFPATNCPQTWYGDKRRPTVLPYWLFKALNHANADPANNIPADIDAVSGATMRNGFKVFSKINGGSSNKVRIVFEILQAYDWNWYFTKQKEADALNITDGETHVGEWPLVYAVEIDLASPTGTVYNLGGTELNIMPAGYYDFTAKNLNTELIDPVSGNFKFTNAHLMTKSITVKLTD